MSFVKRWTISCDYAGCAAPDFVGLPVPSKDQSLTMAFKAGWGRMRIGKFDQWIYICQEHREELQQRHEPNEFDREIVDCLSRPVFTIKLSCGHELLPSLPGALVEIPSSVIPRLEGTYACPACRLEWLASGEILGEPNLCDLITIHYLLPEVE